jgi:hypothetical protein
VAFQYKKRDAGAWEKRASQQGGDYQGFIVDEAKVYTPKKGDNFVRILPPTFENAGHYGIDVWVHYGIGPDRASAICLQKMKNMPCPLCEARARAERGGDEDLAGELKPSRRVMVYMLDRKDEAAGPQVWSMPWTLDREVCKISRDKRTGQVYAIDDPNEGYDLSFEREGEGMMVKYAGIQLSRRPSSVDEETLEYISTLPLPMVLRWREYQELHELFAGSGMEQTAAVNKPVAPVSLARRPIAAARPATPPLAAEEPPPPEPPEDEPPFDPVPARDPPPRPIAPAAAAAAVPSGEVTGKSRAALLREKLAAR